MSGVPIADNPTKRPSAQRSRVVVPTSETAIAAVSIADSEVADKPEYPAEKEALGGDRRPSSNHHSAAGRIVDGRYRVGAEIARGSWSIVYDAEQIRTGHRVALKMLLANLPGGDDKAEERFFREARMTAQLEHPNTVRVFDVGRTDEGALYFASERLVGKTLEEELESLAAAGETMSELESIEVAVQILRSLKEAHSKGLVHRDLKPANLFVADVGGEKMIKVLDFGIARLIGHRITERGVALGSPDYMSPEQCACQDVDARSDLYSLCAMLFHLVTGQPPFVGEDEWEVIDLHRSADVPDPRNHTKQELSAAFAQLLMRGLSKHPGARWQDAGVMLQALEDVTVQHHGGRGSARRRASASIPMGGHRRVRQTTGKWTASNLEAPGSISAAVSGGSPFPNAVATSRYSVVTDELIEREMARGPVLTVPDGEPLPNAGEPVAVDVSPAASDPPTDGFRAAPTTHTTEAKSRGELARTTSPMRVASKPSTMPEAPADHSGIYRAVAIGLLLIALGLATLLAFVQHT